MGAPLRRAFRETTGTYRTSRTESAGPPPSDQAGFEGQKGDGAEQVRLAAHPWKLAALAVLLHDIYSSFDLVLLALKELDRRDDTRLAKDYLRGLNRSAGEALFTLG